MKLKLYRFSDNGNDTIGILFVDGKFFSFTLEDESRPVKVKGETRIPKGIYQLGLQKADTPMTLKYREKYPFFKHHIEVRNVPGFTGIYIHPGNNDQHTDGCLLLGDNVTNNTIAPGTLANSVNAWKRLYERLYPLLDKGGQATIEILDENSLP